MAKKITLYFDGVPEECLLVDHKDEYEAHTKDGRFIKFPKDFSSEELLDNSLEEAIKRHNEANKVKPLPAPEPHEDEIALNQWLGKVDDRETQTISASEVGSVESVLESE